METEERGSGLSLQVEREEEPAGKTEALKDQHDLAMPSSPPVPPFSL